MSIVDYNIDHYRADLHSDARRQFPSHALRVGSASPDFVLPTIGHEGAFRFSDHWNSGPLVLVFGSLTAPPCLAQLEALEALSRARGRGAASFLFVYTREVHPGELLPPHRSMDQKTACALRLRQEARLSFPVAIDDLEGTCHRAFGMLPSMAIMIRRGTVILRSEWTDATVIGWALDQHDAAPSAVRPSYHEWLGNCGPEPDGLWHAVMSSAGGSAVADYERERLHVISAADAVP